MKRHPRSGLRLQQGVTLLEVLVSLLVFSIGILGMVALQARAVQYSVDAEDRTRAAAVANEVVSTMWSQGLLDLPATTITAIEARVNNAFDGLPNAAIAVSGAASGVATVSVQWKSPAKRAADPVSVYTTQVAMP